MSPCDGPLLRQADQSGRDKTNSTSSDLEERETSTNPVALLGVEGQEQVVCAFCQHKREDPGMNSVKREESRKKELGDDRDVLTTEEQPEGLHDESEAREAPCASPSHA
ncbi:hypothetical protein NDU88_002793 [Pleurodeles waltl]|uniref:Uncharacterized protein n=1 Tax=Pleurodeles waltl TaxID=8319 RepID=A0AAV7W3F1_PLEWA|nr:hypothetical protein NDU88_002793 [Pleurodeles waltl]